MIRFSRSTGYRYREDTKHSIIRRDGQTNQTNHSFSQPAQQQTMTPTPPTPTATGQRSTLQPAPRQQNPKDDVVLCDHFLTAKEKKAKKQTSNHDDAHPKGRRGPHILQAIDPPDRHPTPGAARTMPPHYPALARRHFPFRPHALESSAPGSAQGTERERVHHPRDDEIL